MKDQRSNIYYLIHQGQKILRGLTLKSERYNTYSLESQEEFEEWRNITLRFIRSSFPDDFQCEELARLFNSFCAGQTHSPVVLERILGIIKGYNALPLTIKPKSIDSNIGTQVNINNNNNQSQSQQQSINIFLEAIKDDLTGKQIKELKAIVEEENGDLEKAKPKIIDKIKSLGSNVATNIVANIITNPAIWGGF